ncbi:hypothetical protein [Streptomyces virginiae]|uniref:hypothetical protein n=1 Tax=Streptomyces virginiae TaxID=1961 RepID=UPI002DDA882C|nr:hypothetical protein [Streptomyces virginiae]WSC78976.1 hypothetical protein OHA56_23195 [Streptomyces virginiae]
MKAYVEKLPASLSYNSGPRCRVVCHGCGYRGRIHESSSNLPEKEARAHRCPPPARNAACRHNCRCH